MHVSPWSVVPKKSKNTSRAYNDRLLTASTMVVLVLLYEVGEARKQAKRRSKIDIFTFGHYNEHSNPGEWTKKFFSRIHLKVVPFDSSRRGESSVL